MVDAYEYELKMKQRPHVVLLGAGASVAAIPNGDRNGQRISAMAGFIDRLGMRDVIEKCSLSTSSDNLEDIYMEMYDKPECNDARKLLEQKIEEYFSSFEIPVKPTVYDFLILGLTKKDLIATFNWDPLLLQAYERCGDITDNLPDLAFLHGNVGIGLCEKDRRAGLINDRCEKCGGKFDKIPLLYPVRNKDYQSNRYIADSWNALKQYMERAYRLTIFGYSAPKSDIAAMNMLHQAWGNIEKRNLEEIEIIDIADENVVREAWKGFIHSHHYSVHKDIFGSAIGRYPRRTCELLFDNTQNLKWIDGAGMGFRIDMDFADIRRLLMVLMAEEQSNDGTVILSNPYVVGNKEIEGSDGTFMDDYQIPQFAQMNMFGRELLRMIDEGQSLPIEDVCVHIENRNIVDYVKSTCGFKNINISVDNIKDVNAILAEKVVGENEAKSQGITQNGLIYLVNLIIEDSDLLLYTMDQNAVYPDSYR